MGSEKFKSVEDYGISQGPVKAKTTAAVINAILVRFPELESKVSWNVPTILASAAFGNGAVTVETLAIANPAALNSASLSQLAELRSAAIGGIEKGGLLKVEQMAANQVITQSVRLNAVESAMSAKYAARATVVAGYLGATVSGVSIGLAAKSAIDSRTALEQAKQFESWNNIQEMKWGRCIKRCRAGVRCGIPFASCMNQCMR